MKVDFDWGLFWLGSPHPIHQHRPTSKNSYSAASCNIPQPSAWGEYSAFVYVSILFAVLHIGYNSLADILFVFIVGFAFGLIVLRTGSLLGVTIAHGLTNTVLFLVVPFLILGDISVPDISNPDISAWAQQTLEDIGPSSEELPTRIPPAALIAGAAASPTEQPSQLSPTPTLSPTAPASTALPTATPTTAAAASFTPTSTEPPPSPTPGEAIDYTPLVDGGNVTTAFDDLNLRLGPGQAHASLGFLDPGLEYELLGQSDSGDWLLICCYSPDEPEGWVSADYVTIDQVSAGPGPVVEPTSSVALESLAQAVVSVDRLEARVRPGFDSPAVSEQLRGSQFDVIARTPSGDWWYICCAEGAPGWVYHKSVTLLGDPFDIPLFDAALHAPAPPSASQPAPQPAAQPAAQIAQCPPPAADSGLLSSIGEIWQSLVDAIFPSDDPCRQ